MENYTKFSIRKRNKRGVRVIYNPNDEIREIQSDALFTINKNIRKEPQVWKPSMFAKAFQKKNKWIEDSGSTLNFIKPHKGNRFFLKLDFNKFFESIKQINVHYPLRNSTLFLRDEKLMNAIRTCFIDDKLIIGSLLAPYLSNIVMRKFDNSVYFSLNNSDKSIVYTRFADDILISSKQRINVNKVKNLMRVLFKKYNLNLTFNHKKTHACDTNIKPMRVFGVNILRNKIYFKRVRDKYLNYKFETEEHKRGYKAWLDQIEKLAVYFNDGKKWWTTT